MKMRAVGAALAVVLATIGATVHAQSRKSRATVIVKNESSYAIHQLYLTPHDSEDWGPDQLGDLVVDAKTGSFKLTDIPCDVYDVQLVDEDGDQCVVEEVDICAANETWTITDKDLLACIGWNP